MTVGTVQNVLIADSFQNFIENETIIRVDRQKLLGGITDKNLTWDKQTDAVCFNYPVGSHC